MGHICFRDRIHAARTILDRTQVLPKDALGLLEYRHYFKLYWFALCWNQQRYNALVLRRGILTVVLEEVQTELVYQV